MIDAPPQTALEKKANKLLEIEVKKEEERIRNMSSDSDGFDNWRPSTPPAFQEMDQVDLKERGQKLVKCCGCFNMHIGLNMCTVMCLLDALYMFGMGLAGFLFYSVGKSQQNYVDENFQLAQGNIIANAAAKNSEALIDKTGSNLDLDAKSSLLFGYVLGGASSISFLW